jgi:DNA polymerase sigma
MPYKGGSERLEKAKGPIKAKLTPEEEKKLTGDMRELYGRLLPSEESDQRRAKFVEKLEKILNAEWPGKDIKVHIFGSSGNSLCTSESDGLESTWEQLDKVIR